MGYGLCSGFSNGMGSGLQHYPCFLAVFSGHTLWPYFICHYFLGLAQSSFRAIAIKLNFKVKVTG